jgi:very-short-patch-repair endonuclease
VQSLALKHLLDRQCNVLTRRQALRVLPAKAIRHALDSGRWRQAHFGVYVAQTGPLSTDQRTWLAILSAGGDRCAFTCLAGLSALRAWGLTGVEPDAIHVLVPEPRRARVPALVRLHRTRVPPKLSPHLRPPATMPGRSVIEAAAWARSEREARLIVAASFQQGLVALTDVQRAADELSNARRRRLVLETAEDCAGGSHSLAELDLLDLCRRFRLPQPTRQVVRRDRSGRRRFMDAIFEPWRLVVEIDGAHHLEVGQMWQDALKSNSLQLDGYRVLRYPAFAVRTQAKWIAGEIAEALHSAGWSPGSG